MSAAEWQEPATQPVNRNRRRSPARWYVLALVLLALIVGAVFAYQALKSYLAANGEWYGPVHVQTFAGTVSFEAYMNLSTYLNGSLSGSGQFCVVNPLGGGTTTIDTSVSGTRDGSKATVTISYAAPVIGFALGPGLSLHGKFTGDTFDLAGGDANTPTTLLLKRGSQHDFANACKAIQTIG